MRRKVLVLCLVLLQMLAALPLPASAAETQTESRIRLIELSYPKVVKAGTTMTFRVKVDAAKEGGITCCGGLDLKGPGEQYVVIDLKRAGDGLLEGSFEVSPHSPPGSWTIRRLNVQANSWAQLDLWEGASFRHGFTVINPDREPDTTGPELLSLNLPETAKIGEGFPITITAKDDRSGVARAVVVVRPTQSNGGNWSEKVVLHPTGTDGEFTASMVMDPGAVSYGYNLAVAEVVLYDKAGNYTWLKAQDLENRKLRTTVRPVDIPVRPELLTSPFLDLIHPGRLTYNNWRAIDEEHLKALLERIPSDPVSVREHLVAEITQIRAALDRVKGEVYTDPTTGLRVSPFATTGKWLVLQKAMLLRTVLLALTHEPAGSVTEALLSAYRSYLKAEYGQVAGGDTLLPLDGGYNLRYARLSAAYLHFFAHAPEAVAVLKMPADQSYTSHLTEMDPNVIYFMPIKYSRSGYWQPGRGNLLIPAYSDKSMYREVRALFYHIGLHFGEVFFSAADDEHRDQSWHPYITLRHGHTWPEGRAGETPATNLAMDFVASFLPFDLDFSPGQSYRPLRHDPEMTMAFREMVNNLLKSAQPGVAFSAGEGFQVGLEDTWRLTVTSPGVQAVMVAWAKADPNAEVPLTEEPLPATVTEESITFTSRPVEMGRGFVYTIRAIDGTGRDYYRNYGYLQVPLLLEPVPAGTNQSSVRLTGTTLPGRMVTAGNRSTTADAAGRFTLDVPLQPGENLLRVTVSGIDLGARLVVHADPSTAAVPLTITKAPPAVTKEAYAIVEGKTAPFAVIKIGSREFQADSEGKFWAYQYLPTRQNTVELVSTDRFGNQAVWTQQVARDMGPPPLTVHVTPLSPATREYTLYTDPGVRLFVNGDPLQVDKKGRARFSLTLGEGETRELVFVAEDGAGNRTEKRFTFSRQEE